MGIPVYIIMGFLESGKTSFINDMLSDEGFNDGERTLLLCCEEGEVEYTQQALKMGNAVVRVMEDVDELPQGRLNELHEELKPERVIIEYNGTWPITELYDAPKPDEWELAQIVTLVSMPTFDLYLNNMRKMMSEGLSQGDMIIFNRCDPELKKGPYRRKVLAMNNGARVIFENTDNTMEDGVDEEDLPYDMAADPIVIADDQFGRWYLDCMEHPKRYDGRRVEFKCRSFFMEDLPKKCFIAGRHAMTCCADDIGGIGFICRQKGAAPKNGDWHYVTAKCEYGFSQLHGCEGIILIEESREPAIAPKEELVYFN